MFSLSEIEAQCKKAAKGFGYSWGIAEEAGILARNLSEIGLPGPDVVYKNLNYYDNSESTYLTSIEDIFLVSDYPVSGFLLGVSIIDRIQLIEKNLSWKLVNIVAPLAIAGVLLRLKGTNYSFFLEWENCKIQLNQHGFKIVGRNINPEIVEKIEINIKQSEQISKVEFFEMCEVSDLVWEKLSKMAKRTYVPASETSRIRGAGAGIFDTD